MRYFLNILLFALISANILCAQVKLDTVVRNHNVPDASFLLTFKNEGWSGEKTSNVADFIKKYSVMPAGLEDSLKVWTYLRSELVSRIFSIGIPLGKNNKLGPTKSSQFRIGTGYSKRSFNVIGFITEIVPYDTSTSTTTGNPIYIDSVISRAYYVSHNALQIPLEVSWLRFNYTQPRIFFFLGVGLVSNLSILTDVNTYSPTYINFYERDSANTQYNFSNAGTYPSYPDLSSETNQTDKSISWSAEFFVPFGFGYRFGNKDKSWGAFQLFYESRPGIALRHIPVLGTVNSVRWTHCFGVRLRMG